MAKRKFTSYVIDGPINVTLVIVYGDLVLGISHIDRNAAEFVAAREWRLDCFGYVTDRGQDGQRLHRLLLNSPAGMVVDHINGDKLDNRRANLRAVSIKVNVRNCHAPVRSNTGVRGVCTDRRSPKSFRAYIDADGKRVELGRFSSLTAAQAARLSAEDRLWGQER